MKKIYFIIGKLSNGGAERVISILANRFSVTYDVTIVTVSKSSQSYKICENVKIINLLEKLKFQNGILRVINKFILLKKIINRNNPDTVISFLSDVNVYSIIAAYGSKSKIIVSERNYPKLYKYQPYTILIYNINKLLYKLADVVVFQTDEIANCFSNGVKSKSLIIGNPITESLPLHCSNPRNDIVTVARLTKQKNIKLLIDAFLLLNNEIAGYVLKIYGDGPDRKRLEEIYRNEINDNLIKFCGFDSKVHHKISESKLFVLSSDVEGMPNALMEAMSIGIPAVATDSRGGGVRKISLNGQFVKLSKIKCAEELKDNMKETLLNYNKHKAIAMEGKKFIDEEYSLDKVYKEWMDIV